LGISTFGSTAGNTGLISTGAYFFAGSNGITASQSANTNGNNGLYIQGNTTYIGNNTAGTNCSISANTSGLSINVPSFASNYVGVNTAATNVTWTVNSSGLSLNAGGYAGVSTAATNCSLTLNTGGLAVNVYEVPCPSRVTLWADEATVTVGSALVRATLGFWAPYGTQSYQGTAALNDARTTSFYLAAGTYTFFTIGIADSNRGQVALYLDGVAIVTGQEWYNATSNTLSTLSVTSVTVTGNGRHILKSVVTGKNGSSGGYYYSPIKHWFVPASDTSSTY